jgi:GrpB-like predicted nucleotidyltransferase (UPF0157 family)
MESYLKSAEQYMKTNPNYINRKYQVLPYDPSWRERFEKEAQTIKEIFTDNIVRIEHIGSTSVPGMSGKPLVDVLVLVKDVASIDQHNETMQKAGLTPKGDLLGKGGGLFIRENGNENLTNVHVYEDGHEHVPEMLNLRNYLREHPEEVEAYSDIKKELIAKYQEDYGSYRREKDVYMEELKKRANA